MRWLAGTIETKCETNGHVGYMLVDDESEGSDWTVDILSGV
jgi:hypothetical protein